MTKKPKHITFTGVDNETDLDRLVSLSNTFPCEWGILFSRNRQGLDNRYPSPTSPIFAKLGELKSAGCIFAAHLCGRLAEMVMRDEFALLDITDTPIDFSHVNRIQVNHHAPVASVLRDFAEHHGKEIICQYRGYEFPDMSCPSVLYDPSGGNGLQPTRWPTNPYHHFVGYAGGINPLNVFEINETVSQLTVGDYWLDMETGVRTDDFLDLDKCEAVLREIYR